MGRDRGSLSSNWLNTSAKLLEDSFALVGHLLDGKILLGINLKCVAFCKKLVNKTVSKKRNMQNSDGSMLYIYIYIYI